MVYHIYCDGGSRGNPGPSACAFITKLPTGDLIFSAGEYLGIATNNQAEYMGVLSAVSWLSNLEHKPSQVNFFLDSLLVVNQFNGKYRIKDTALSELYNQIISQLSSQHINYTFTHIAREINHQADLLVNQTLDKRIT